jgi:hypothetical protein
MAEIEIPPEYASIEEFVEYLLDEDREQYDHEDLQLLAYSLRTSLRKVRAELDSWGLTLKARPHEQEVRGFSSWDENRWQGNPCGGGSGWEQIAGIAGRKG